MGDVVKWTEAEYDLIAQAAHKMPVGTNRVTMLREGQKVLPAHRRKVIPDHLGGKSFTALKAALERVGGKRALKQATAAHARHKMTELRKTLAGQGIRMAEAMQKAGKSDADVANATGVHLHSIRTVLRDKSKTMMDRNVARVATYLGVNYGWLRAGVDAEMPLEFTIDAVAADNQPDRSGGELAPTAARVFKANGKATAHPTTKLDASLNQNLDSALAALMSMVPPDVKAMVLARVAELIAQNAATRR